MREMCNLKATQRQSITRSPAPGPNPITASLHLRHSLAQRLEALLELLDEHVQHVVYDRLAAAAQLRTARDDRPRRPEEQPVEAARARGLALPPQGVDAREAPRHVAQRAAQLELCAAVRAEVRRQLVCFAVHELDVRLGYRGGCRRGGCGC